MAKVTLFAQIIAKLPKEIIKKVIRQHKTDKHAKGYNTMSQLISMIFCQFSNSESVRDISYGLKSATGNLNHLGIPRAPSKSNISYQNAHRTSEVFKDIYYTLFNYFGQQRLNQHRKFKFKQPIKLLDSSMMTLTLSLYDWAHYTSIKGAVKMHTLLDHDNLLPEFVCITDGKKTDAKGSFDIPVAANSIVVEDRGYCGFELLNHWDSNRVFFVVRHKEILKTKQIEERDLPQKKHQDILLDEIIELERADTYAKYPKRLRRVVVWNEEHQYKIELLTNNFDIAASSIAALYKERWQIEIFFRHIKQNLRIKSFIGTTQNAVEIQIWTALITILLLCWLKSCAQYKWALSNLVASLRLNTFTKIDLEKWLNEPLPHHQKKKSWWEGDCTMAYLIKRKHSER